MKFSKVLYMGLGGVVALAIAGAAFFFVQTSQAAQSGPAVMAAFTGEDGVYHGRGPGGRGQMPGGRLDVHSYLLDELGITQEEFDAARETARNAAVDRAVEAGLLTEDQGEALKEGTGFGRRGPGPGFHGLGQEIDHDQLMADALGISLEEWETAKENAREAAIAQALEEGTITQEQVDLMAAHEALRGYIDKEALMAGALGVTAEELAAAREAGTVRDLVEDSGLTAAEIREALAEAHAAAIDQAVVDGVITAEQAELLNDAPAFGPGGHGGRGGRGGRGFHGGPRGFGPQDGLGQGQNSFGPGPAAGSFSG